MPPTLKPKTSLPFVRWLALLAALAFTTLALLPQETYRDILSRGSGGSAAAIAPRLPLLFTGLAIAGAAWTAACWLIGNRVDRQLIPFAAWMTTDPKKDQTGRGAPIAWALVCCVLVLAFDWRSLAWGYFESDDYNFLIDNRVYDFPALMYAVMNDHVFPLGRVLIHVFHWMFGTNAYAYNALAVGSLILLIGSGCMFLVQAGVSRLATLLFAMLMVGWTMWGEFTSGEYILLLYESITTSALLLGWATMRWGTTRHYRHCLLTSLLVAYACFSSISGFWVSCAAVVFLTCEIARSATHSRWHEIYRPSNVAQHWPQLSAIVVPTLLAILFYMDAYQRADGPDFLSSAGERHGISGLTTQWFYTNTTALLSVPLAIPHHLVDFGMMKPAMILSSLAAIVAIAIAWPTLKTRSLRSPLAAVLLIMSGVALMVCLGRPEQGIGYVVPPKYLFMSYTWTCLAMAIVFDGFCYRITPSSRPLLLKLSLCAVLILWTLQGTASLLGGWGMPFFETTRGGELREHRREQAAIAELRQTLFEPLDRKSSGPIRIADIPGDMLCRQYPALRFPWGHEPQLSYMLDVLAEDPDRYEILFTSPLAFPTPIVTRSLRSSVSPEFITLLQESESANRLYSLPSRINAKTIQGLADSSPSITNWATPENAVTFQKTDIGGWLIQSDGQTRIQIAYPDWYSEHRTTLKLGIQTPSDAKAPQLGLTFRSDLFPNPIENTLAIHTGDSPQYAIDLLKIPSFALSERIDSLTLHLRQPGQYRLDHLSVENTPETPLRK